MYDNGLFLFCFVFFSHSGWWETNYSHSLWDPEIVLLPPLQWFFTSLGVFFSHILITVQLKKSRETSDAHSLFAHLPPIHCVLFSSPIVWLVHSSCFVHPEFSTLSPQLRRLPGCVWVQSSCVVGSCKLSGQ